MLLFIELPGGTLKLLIDVMSCKKGKEPWRVRVGENEPKLTNNLSRCHVGEDLKASSCPSKSLTSSTGGIEVCA